MHPPPSKLPLRKLSVIAVAACFSGAVLANPTAPTVVHGNASFASAGNILNITNSPNAIINWGSFSIGVNELTRFIQQSGNSAVLNRVIGQDPSAILGSLQSNGRVFIINPNGIVFGAGAQVNVAGLVASTLKLSNEDFLNNRMNFTDGAGAGSVVNQGSITGGSVYLIGKAVSNDGLITSPNGEVILAAGNSVELVNPGTPHLRVEVVAPDNEARNLGTISAEAGRIGIYAGLIKQGGTLNASSAVAEGGRILLKAARNTTLDATSQTTASGTTGGTITVQSGDTTLVSGTIETKGNAGTGGMVQVLGNKVGLIDAASIDASGQTGGGTVLVGGDYQGRNPEVQNATRTLVAPGAEIRADSVIDGDGGKVVVWADGDTRYHGTISARGGADAGNGGFVEVSGKQNLTFTGGVDTTSPKGAVGTLLLDPDDLYISAGPVGGAVQDTTNPFQANDGVNDYYVLNTTLQALPATTAVQLQANHDIIFQTGLAMPTTGAGSVTLNASHAITMAGFGLTTAGGNVSMTAGTGGITNLGAIDLGSGALTLNSTGAITQNAGSLISGATSLVKQGAGKLTLSNANTYTGLTTVSAGVLNLQNSNAAGTTAGGVTVANGAALELQGGITVGAEALSITGTGVGATGALRNTGGANSWGGTVTLTGASEIQSDVGTLTLNAANAVTGANTNLTVDGPGSTLVSGTITTGSGTLTKAGAGTLTLQGANTYTGLTTVSAGVLNLQNSNATGTTAGGVTVANGAALELQGGITVGAEALSITGTGVTANGALRNIGGDNAWGGTVTLTGASEIQSDAGTLTLNAANAATGANTNLTVDGAGNTLVSGTITTGTGTLTKAGAGRLTLSAANTYTGLTTVGAGVLNLQNSNATGTTAGGVTVANGAALELQGGIAVGAEALTLSGTGILATGALRNISGDNTWGGTVTLAANSEIQSDAGTLTLNAANAVNAAVARNLAFDGAGNGLISGTITTLGGTVTKTGAGRLTLSGANTYTGVTTVSAGVLNLQNNTATGTVAGGVTVAAGAALELQGGITVGAEALSINGTGVVGNGALRNISGDNNWGGAVTLAANTEIQSDADTLTLNTVTGATRTLTFDGAGNGLIGGAITTTTGGLIKNGTGALTLQGASTYTGATAVNAGNLTLSGANGSVVAGAGSIFTVHSGGTLTLDNSVANNTNRISDTNTLTLNGGEFNFIGSNVVATNASETVGALALPANASTITAVAGSGGSTQLTFASVNRTAGGGATVLFRGDNLGDAPGANNTNIAFTVPAGLGLVGGNSSMVNKPVVPWAIGDTLATGSGTGFVTYNIDPLSNAANATGIRPLSLATEYTTATGVAGVNLAVTASVSPDVSQTFNSMLLSGGSTYTIGAAGAAKTVTVTSGAIFSAAGAANTITGRATPDLLAFGAVEGKVSALGNLDITTARITGTAGLTKTGAGDLTLGSANTYTGTTTINRGTLFEGVSNAIANGAVTVRSGGVFDLNGNSDAIGALNLDSGFGTGASVMTGAGTLTLGGNVALNANGLGATGATISGNLALGATRTFTVANGTAVNDLDVSAIVSGATFGIIKAGTGTLDLSGSNTYTGATAINAGVLSVDTLANGGVASNIGQSTSAAGNLVLGGGTLQYTGATTGIDRNFTLTAATTSSIDVASAASNLTLSGASTATTGNLTKIGGGTLTLSGANLYTGRTTINAGVLSANTLANGGVASSIGASTNAAANLVLGGGTLQYTGGTVSTNRNYTLSAGTTSAIDVTNGGTALTISGASTNTTGALVKNGSGTLMLSGANLYTGLTTINAGTLQYGAANALNTGGVTVNDGGTYDLNGFSDSIGALTVNSGIAGGSVTTGAGILTLTGNIASTGGAANAAISGNLNFAATRTVTTTNAADGLTISAAISGAGGLTKAGAGRLTLSGNSSYTGVTTVGAGVLNLQNSNATGTTAGGVTVAAGAALELQGGIAVGAEALTLSGTGILANGALRNISGDNSWGGTVTLAANTEIQSDAGTLTLGGAPTSVAATTRTLTFDGAGNGLIAGAVTGTTATLTKNGVGTLTLQGANSYQGATTVNAGVLNLQNNTATGTVAGGVTVAAGAALELQGGITVGAEALSINGTGVVGNGALRNISGDNSWGGAVTLAGNSEIQSDAGTLTLNTVTGATRTLTFDGAGNGLIGGAITTTTGGLIKNGAGTLALQGASTYTGATAVNVGVLNVQNAQGTGTVAGGVTVANHAALELQGGITVGAEALTISGAGVAANGALRNISGNNNWGGAVTLAANTEIQSDAGTLTLNTVTGATRTLTFDGAGNGLIGGAISTTTGGLIKNGAGVLTLQGANSYQGATSVTAGTLVASNASALGTTAGGTSVSSGATLNINNVAIGGEAVIIDGNGVGGAGALTGTGAASLAGTLALAGASRIGTTSGASTLTLVGAVSAGGNTLDITGAGNVTATNVLNDFATVTINGAGNVALADANAIILGASTVSGTLDVSAGTTISQSGALTLSGAAATFTSTGGGAITLSDIAGGGQDVTVNTAGLTTISGTIAGIDTLTTDAPGTVSLVGPIGAASLSINEAAPSICGSIGSGAGAISIAGAVTLCGDTILNAVSASFGSTIDSAVGNRYALTANMTGAFASDAIGSIDALSALTVSGGTTINAGAIRTVGGTAQPGGDVVLSGSGAVITAAIDTTGGNATNTAAGAGGSINASGSSVSTGAITTSGGSGTNGAGGAAGNVTLAGTSGVTASGAIITAGGSGDNNPAGAGGAVNISGGAMSLGAIATSGGSGTNGAGGAAGNVTLAGTSGVTASGAIITAGGSGDNNPAGAGGAVNISGGAMSLGVIATSGGAGINGLGGNAGVVVLNGTSTIVLSGDIYALGGDATNNLAGSGGAVTVNGTGISLAAINTSGGTSNNAGGAAGSVSVTGSGAVNASGSITAAGGASLNQPAGAGGNVTIAGADVAVAAVTTDGGTASNGQGGDAGIMVLDATDGTPTVTLAGNLSSRGGTGQNNPGGAGQAIAFSDPVVLNGDLTFFTRGGTGTVAGADGGASNTAAVSGATRTLTLVLGSGNASFANAGNDFGTVAVTSANNVTLADQNAIILGTSAIGGDLAVTAGGLISQSGALSVTGNAAFDTSANAGIGSVSLVAGSTLTAGDSNVGGNLTVQVTAGDLLVPLGETVTVAGAIDAEAAGNIIVDGTVISGGARSLRGSGSTVITLDADTDISTLTLPGTGSITINLTSSGAGSGAPIVAPAITLTNPGNSFGGQTTLNTAMPGGSTSPGTYNLTQSAPVTLGAAQTLSITDAGGTAGKRGNVTLFNASNDFSTVAFGGGDFQLADTNALTLGVTSANAGSTSTGTLLVQSGGGLTLGGNVSAAAAGDSLVLAAGTRFDNTGGFTLNPGGGRFLVWSGNPDPFGGATPDNRGGLGYDFKQYDATYGVTAVAGSGDGFLYTLAPTITPSLVGTTSKVYDGSTAATLVAGNYATSAGVDGDTITLNNPAAGTYDTRNVGSGKTVTATGLTVSANNGLADVFGYTLTSTSASSAIGEITARAITVTAVTDTKTYDGSTSSAGVPTITVGSLAPVGGDTAAFTQAFDNRNAGVGKTLTPTGSVTDGNGGNNYLVTLATDGTGVINQRLITVTAVTDTKTYDGSTSSAGVPTITVGSLAPVGGDTAAFTQAFDNRNAGVGKTLTPTGSVTDGNGGNNYLVTLATDGTGVINQRLITVTAVTDTKTYDGSTSSAGVPTITVGSLAPVGGDTAAFTQAFDNRNAGVGKTLTPTGSVTDGNGGNNYLVTLATDGTGVINQRLITVTAVTDTKTYDGSTSSAGVPTITVGSLAPVGGDTAAFTQAFDNRNAGVGKTLTPTGSVTDGNGGNNYLVTLATDGTGVINQRLITVTAVTDTKTYDGSTSSAGVPTITVGSLAPVGGDTAAFTQAFDNRNAGVGKTLTPTGSVTDGNGGNNYLVTLATDGTGVINQRLITVTAVTDTKTYDGSTSSAGVPTITVGSLAPVGGDTAAFTQAFDNRNAGVGKTLTPTGSVTDGNGGNNYLVTLATDGTGVINQRLITVTAVTDTKTYDGSTSSAGVPTITVGSLAPVGGDTAAFTQAFDNRNAGVGKTLTPTGSVTDGNGGNNYLVTLATDGTGVINQRLITVTAVTDTKTYDGSTSSAGVPTITVGSLAPVGGDTAAFTQAFDNRNAGVGKTLTPTGSVTDGNGGNNYLVTLATDGTGVINQRLITVTAVTDTKTYDGSTSSAGVPTITVGSLAPVGGDTAAFTQAFDNRNAGVGKTLTPTGSVTDGNGGNNYLVTLATDGTGVINQRLITVTAVTDTKTYDGSTSSAGVPTITVGSLAPVGGDTAAFTQAFDNRNAGVGKTLTPTGSVTDGNGGNNYLVTLATDGTGVINQRLITVTAVTDTKTYDGSTSSAGVPTITVGSLAPVGGDTAAFTQAFDNRNAGVGKTLTPTGSVTDGNGGNNYLVTLATDGTGVINQRLITVTAVTDTKTYDGSTSSAGVPTITVGSLAPVGGDTAAFTQAFDNRNAGVGKTLTPTGSVTDGNGGNNYLVTLATDGTGVITAAPLTVTANDASKVFGQVLVFAGTEFMASGLVAGETIGSVTLTSAGAAAAATVAGSPYAINPSAAVGGTFAASNYTITYQPGLLTVTPGVNPPGGTFLFSSRDFLNAMDSLIPIFKPYPPFVDAPVGCAGPNPNSALNCRIVDMR